MINFSITDNSLLHQDLSIKTLQLAFHHEEIFIRIYCAGNTNLLHYYNFWFDIIVYQFFTLFFHLSNYVLIDDLGMSVFLATDWSV